MPVDPSARKPSEDWLGIVRKNRMPEFAAACTSEPALARMRSYGSASHD
jgi:hypothetical protein